MGRFTNCILSSLPADSLSGLAPRLERVPLLHGHFVGKLEEPITHLYFVERGMISLVKPMHDGRVVEISAVGIEGLADPSAIFDVSTSILESVVQIPGEAYRIGRRDLHERMRADAALHDMMHRYVGLALNQIAQTAACNALHSLEARCCRWLLIAHDSARADVFPLTHEFLAMMLGVQRASISLVAKMLERAGLISYSRGIMTIVDRSGIEDASCECFATIREKIDEFAGLPKAS